MRMGMRPEIFGLMGLAAWMALLVATPLQAKQFGPWNTVVLQGGTSLDQPLPAHAALLSPRADWTAYTWVKLQTVATSRQLLAGVGNPLAASRYFLSDDGRLAFWWGNGKLLTSQARLQPGKWYFVAAVAKGHDFTMYVDGHRVATGAPVRQKVAPRMIMGPMIQPWPNAVHFGGKLAGFAVNDGAMSAQSLAVLARHAPDALTRYEPASPHWPVQTRQMAGQVVPQPPSTLPHSKDPFSQPTARRPEARIGLKADSSALWTLDDWYLASATRLDHATGQTLSTDSYKPGADWLVATVPGTVLTTLVHRGVYPDPSYGLNNMAIPESLHMHDWWYRTRFLAPTTWSGKHLLLTFNGINYASHIWLNGKRIGGTRGAFVRGALDVTGKLLPGKENIIAVRVSPPPDAGVAHEQSLLAGPGPNGGMETLDGPTFFADEGWDWIPAVRDRNTGIWQDVTVRATDAIRIGDTNVITRFPKPDLSVASVEVDVPLNNATPAPVSGTLHIAFEGVDVNKVVTVEPGNHVVRLTAADFPQLLLAHPRLWWPNGYGKANLYNLEVSFQNHGAVSDDRHLQFGIRDISYELSLFDQQGHLRRVLINPSAKQVRTARLVDVRHQAILKTPDGWAASLMPGAESSPAVTTLSDQRLTPYLVIRVNHVRIAMKGGSWGTDDWLKRVSKKHLEPYFRLQHNAHMNVIRNWVGQNTEPVFYRLADKYGMLVINDFWQSTQNYNLEPQDDALFLRNAADVLRRYRHHPSIALWFGRNEGVPQPLLNQRLDKLIARLDGTRLYLPSSNEINLQKSGPYNYREPSDYFTHLGRGFAVEIGTPSFPTLEAFKAMMPAADQWPISDDWAYHDWHQSGNGDTASFMSAMKVRYGKARSLNDFARKAQMMNYVDYRAIFEGFNAHLWTQNSGRLLWMSHPAWPSTTWQLYSHDYDTNASYYGAMHAAEPVHVQMNLPDHSLAVINATTQAHPGLVLSVKTWGLHGKSLGSATATVNASAGVTTPVRTQLNIDQLVTTHKLVFVQLQLRDASGKMLSRNFYWAAAKPGDLRVLDQLRAVPLQVIATQQSDGRVKITLRNASSQVALNTKLTLLDGRGKRILPAYYSDNYISLSPGEAREVELSTDGTTNLDGAHVELRGWNVSRQDVGIHRDRGRATTAGPVKAGAAAAVL